MFYKIIDTGTDDRYGVTYVLVHFWDKKADFNRGNPPFLVNDFYIDVPATRTVYKKNASGKVLTKSGKEVELSSALPPVVEDAQDPFQTEEIEVDVVGYIEGVIDRYVERATAKGYTGDKSDIAVQKSQTDISGVLAKVSLLKNKEYTK